jgi:hypothetical protein
LSELTLQLATGAMQPHPCGDRADSEDVGGFVHGQFVDGDQFENGALSSR